ncbi:hypothetical protein ACLMJK_001235 [Lecanora helva]
MPVVTRRQQMLTSPQLVNVKPSMEDTEAMGEPLWAVEEDYERPHKEMDFPMTPLGKVPSRKESMNNLRINTYTPSDLHERYMESEEEPSPSPDSDNESNDGKLMHKVPTAGVEEAVEPTLLEDYKAEVATAVPIMAVGRPKLVDIMNIAPMQKRKRTEKTPMSRSAVKNVVSRIPATTSENSTLVAQDEHLPKREDSLKAPESWLPEDDTVVHEEDDHYFPDLELRNPPSYNDYDPYSLDPPRLSPRNSYNSGKKPGSVARARKSSVSPLTPNNNGWKGLTRTLSIAKKQALHRTDQQVAKKPKMIARAADEREDPLILPAFPFNE